MAGFDRGVRPIGDWSMSITLSNASIPRTARCAPGFTRRSVAARLASALKMTSLTSVLLPEPATPVTQMNLPTGQLDVDVLQVVLGRARDAEPAGVVHPPVGHRDRRAGRTGTRR